MASDAPVLYPYQRRYLADRSRWKAAMWARQTGKTFTTTLEAVLDCLEAEAEGRARRWTILSVNQARALDAIETAKTHLRALQAAFESLSVPFSAQEMAYEIRMPHGSRIRAVAARPAGARGMSDNLILDEFAHHADDRELWRAVLPVVSRPDLKLRVISTPNGKGNLFYEIMTGEEMGRLFSRHVVTIHDAVADGLPRDPAELKAAIADPVAWAQEYECQFVDEATAWLPWDVIHACEHPEAGDPARYAGGPAAIGWDVAARGDLAVLAVVEEHEGRLWLREMREMRGASFAEQLAALDDLMRRYRAVRVAIDQTGMGEMPVEEARRRWGAYVVEGVLFTPARKLDLATALKQAMEDRRLMLPSWDRLRRDLHAVRRETGPTGAPRLIAARTEEGHADRFWALALAVSALAAGGRITLEELNRGFAPLGAPRAALGAWGPAGAMPW